MDHFAVTQGHAGKVEKKCVVARGSAVSAFVAGHFK
jgi:hypothetical protein